MKRKTTNKIKSKENYLLYGLLFMAAIILLFTIVSFLNFQNNKSSQQLTEMHSASRMSLTAFDKQLARNLMDKNNDGLCDACGMAVSACIDSGQLQCNMDPKSTIGILGSQHIHADWKVYINGKSLDFSDKAHMDRMRAGLPVSSFIHVDSDAPAPEKTGDILHMHATGVPLWIFFESLDLKLPDGMKVYVNGKEISDYPSYVFNDTDKILITDSVENLQEQLNSITNFANDHKHQGE